MRTTGDELWSRADLDALTDRELAALYESARLDLTRPGALTVERAFAARVRSAARRKAVIEYRDLRYAWDADEESVRRYRAEFDRKVTPSRPSRAAWTRGEARAAGVTVRRGRDVRDDD